MTVDEMINFLDQIRMNNGGQIPIYVQGIGNYHEIKEIAVLNTMEMYPSKELAGFIEVRILHEGSSTY